MSKSKTLRVGNAEPVTQKILEELQQFGVPAAATYDPERGKVAAPVTAPDRYLMANAAPILNDAVSHGLGMFEAANGHIWRTETIEGQDYLVRDESLSDQTALVKEMLEEGDYAKR